MTRPSAPRMVVPAYFHPAVRPADWARLADRPDRMRLVVLNIGDGPGERRDAAFRPVLDVLRAAGIPVAGYVDTDYGRRPRADALHDLRTYRNWYGVGDVFFDQVSTAAERLGHYRALADTVRDRGAGMVAFNHGAHADQDYADLADLVGTFEGPWLAYRDAWPPRWALTGPAEKFFHLVHSVPPGSLGDALSLARQRNAGGAWVTTRTGRNPWDRFPGALCGATDRAPVP